MPKTSREKRAKLSALKRRCCVKCLGSYDYPQRCHYCQRFCDIYRPFARTFTLRKSGPLHGICRSCAE